MLPQIGRIHPIQLTPLKADESLIANTSIYRPPVGLWDNFNDFLMQIKAKIQQESGEN